MKHIKINKPIALAMAAGVLAAISTYADEFNPYYAGITAGGATPTSLGASYPDSRYTFGTNLGYRFNESVSAGVYFLYSQNKNERLPDASITNLHFLLTGIEGDFYSNWLKGLHAGIKIGTVWNGKIVTAYGSIKQTTEFSWGPKIGYDLNIGRNWLAGVELNSMYQAEHEYSIVNYLVSLKYGFGG